MEHMMPGYPTLDGHVVPFLGTNPSNPLVI